MRSPVRIWLSAPKEKRPLMGGASLFASVGIRTGDLTRRARYNKRAGPKGLSASSNLAISSEITPHGSKRTYAFCARPFLICAPCLLLSKSDPLRWALILLGTRATARVAPTKGKSREHGVFPAFVLTIVLRGASSTMKMRPSSLAISPEIWYFILIRRTFFIPYRRVEQP